MYRNLDMEVACPVLSVKLMLAQTASYKLKLSCSCLGYASMWLSEPVCSLHNCLTVIFQSCNAAFEFHDWGRVEKLAPALNFSCLWWTFHFLPCQNGWTFSSSQYFQYLFCQCQNAKPPTKKSVAEEEHIHRPCFILTRYKQQWNFVWIYY